MVKAVSYGFGTYEIANILQYNKVDYLAVAYTDEGIELRKAGIKLPIMVMNPEIESFNLMIKHQLEPEIYSLRSFVAFIKSVKQNTLFIESGSYPIHLKIDTGMHRLGFEKNEIDELISLIKKAPFIKIESVFSHLVATDEAEHDNFTNEQITLFKQLANSICTQFNYPINKHILNSNGITRFNDAQFDMVRLGIGIYGVSSEKNTQEKLLPVSTLKTRISQLKMVKKGDTIGYGRKGVAEKETTTATVAIGYADGLHRSLGNGKWNMLVNGKKAPIIGNVCMDMTILDVTDINCKEGDEVTVFGPDNPITKMAAISNTIPYEILTSVSTRVKRLFYYE